MPAPAPDSDAIEAWLEGTLPPEEAAAVDAYFEANPDALPSVAEQEDLRQMAGYVPETGASLDALIQRMKTNPGLESQWASPTADADWRELLEPGPMLGMLGPYEVESLIATGGMGILFKARDPKLDRTIALKVLSPQLATNATARERFLREARAAAKLEHENILPIYAVHDGEVPYFSMRYADGGTLEEQLAAEKRLGLEKLKTLTRGVASALEAAHAAGIIHRDIKPANILFDAEEDNVWVCDFGIARSVEDPSLTYAGAVAGTPQYMSPEQAEGANLDGRSDLFSLGSVLFRAATGQTAFGGKTTKAVLRNLADANAPQASQLNTRLPAWYSRLLDNLLAKDPRDRLPDATTVIRCLDDEHSPRPKRNARRNRRLAIAGACLAALLLLAFLLFQLPPVRGAANRTLVSLNGDRATIDGQLGTHADLATAITAAGDGDVIFLHGDAPLSADRIEIPAGKSLTLRAVHGASPLVELTPGLPGIIAYSPLVVEGIRFRDPEPTYSSEGAIAFIGTRGNEVRRCQFHFHAVPVNDFAARRPRALSVGHGAELTIDSCYFDHVESCAVLITDKRPVEESGETPTPNTVTIRSSVLMGSRAITLANFQNNAPVELSLQGCLVASDALLHDFWNNKLPATAIDLESCVLAPTESLLWAPRQSLASLRQQVRWTGRDNTYQRGITYFHDHGELDAGYSAPLRIPHLPEWAASGIPRESGATERIFSLTPDEIRAKIDPADIGRPALDLPAVRHALANPPENPPNGVVIEGVDYHFDDLASAVAAAPDGATLLLRGDLHCPEPVFTPIGRPIVIRAAPGATATIIADAPFEHALFVAGPTTVGGIRFTRPRPAKNALPILGMRPPGSLLVEDCQFYSPPVPGKAVGGFGVGISGNSETPSIIRRCQFDLEDCKAIYLGGGEVLVEDCVVAARGLFHRHDRTPRRAASVTLTRSTVLCDIFFDNAKFNDPLYPTHFEVSDCLIDARDHLFVIPDATLEHLTENLSWTGTGNYYPPNLAILRTPKINAGRNFVPFQLDGLTALPKARSQGAIHGPLFDRQSLPTQPTPTQLRTALPATISSPAIESLDRLIEANASP